MRMPLFRTSYGHLMVWKMQLWLWFIVFTTNGLISLYPQSFGHSSYSLWHLNRSNILFEMMIVGSIVDFRSSRVLWSTPLYVVLYTGVYSTVYTSIYCIYSSSYCSYSHYIRYIIQNPYKIDATPYFKSYEEHTNITTSQIATRTQIHQPPQKFSQNHIFG